MKDKASFVFFSSLDSQELESRNKSYVALDDEGLAFPSISPIAKW